MSSRVAVAGWYGSDNLGDELILRGLVGAVRSRGAEPVVISIDPAATRRDHGVDAVAHRHPGQSPALRRTLSGCDAVVVAGGVIQSETSPWNVGFHTSRLRAAPPSLAGAALGVGVGRVSQRWDRTLAVRSLRRLRRVVVRDADSARRLRDWGLADVAVGADPVISLQPELVTPTDTMCVILRPANRRGLRTAAAKARRMRPAPETLDRIARAIDAAAAATGLEPRFLAFQASRDDSLHTALAERLSAPAQTITPNVETVLAEVARSRLVITMRYHGAIAASAARPSGGARR